MKLKKRLLALLMATCFGLTFTGCTYKDKIVYFELPSGKDTVFKIGDMKCSKSEMLLYLVNAKNIYGTVDGVNLWLGDFNTNVITDSLKGAVMEHLTRVYVLNLYADEREINLSDAENARCEAAAETYYASLNETEISFTGVTKKSISEMYKRYLRAQIVYTKLMNTVNEEVSDDEARVMEAYVLFVSDKASADSVQEMIDYGYTFERLAATYTELDTYNVTFARGTYPTEVDEVVFNLDTEEVSDAIETEEGYYFFQCLDKYNEELSEENKTVIIEARRKQVLEDIVVGLQDEYYSDMNTTLWESIEIPEDISDKLVTYNFFETLAKAK